MNIATFYARRRWTSRWGVVDAAHRTPHRGFDIAHPGRTPVPILRGGRVVVSGTSSIIGHYFAIEVSKGDYDGYCHMFPAADNQTMPQVGQVLATGQIGARLASWGDLHGSAWTGPHLHLTNGRSAVSVHSGRTLNPQPLVESALAGFAGGDPSPLDIQGADMPSLIRRADGSIATVGDTTYQLHSSLATFAADAAAYGTYRQLSDADFAQTIANTQIRLAYLKAQLGGTAGSTVDPAAIAAKVEQNLADDFARLESQIKALDSQVGELELSDANLAGIRQAAKDGTGEALADVTFTATLKAS